MKVWRIIQGNHNNLNHIKEDIEYMSDYIELMELGDISLNQVMTLLNAMEKIGDDPIGIGYNKIKEIGKLALEFCDIPKDLNPRVRSLINTLMVIVFENPVTIDIKDINKVVINSINYFKTGEISI